MGLSGLRWGYHKRRQHPFPLPLAFSVPVPFTLPVSVNVRVGEWGQPWVLGHPRSNTWRVPGRRSRVTDRRYARILLVDISLAFPFPLFSLPLPLSLVTTRGKDR